MAPTAVRLGELLGKEVIMAKDVIGPDAKAKAAALKEGEVLMLENVRFHKEETKNDPAFAKELASMAEIYVNDAFGTAHRAHASTAGLPTICRRYADTSSKRKLRLWARLCQILKDRLWQYWAVPRFQTK